MEKPLIFIYQFGFKQISLPPEKVGMNNFEVIDIYKCEDGCRIQTTGELQEDFKKLQKLIGRKVIKVYCDTNTIDDSCHLTECRITTNEHSSEEIFIWT